MPVFERDPSARCSFPTMEPDRVDGWEEGYEETYELMR
jgi:hypothetical protein